MNISEGMYSSGGGGESRLLATKNAGAGLATGLGLFEAGMIGAIVIAALLVGVGLFLFRSFVHGGYLLSHRQVLREGSAPLGVLFSGGGFFLAMVLYKLITLGLFLGVIAVAAIPAALVAMVANTAVGLSVGTLLGLPALVWLGLGLTMGEHAIVFEDKTPVDALMRSLELAHGNRMGILLYGLACFGLIVSSLVGILLLCIGVLFTTSAARAVCDVGYTRGFLLFTGAEQRLDGEVSAPEAGGEADQADQDD
jgi:hypothetical protein